MTTLVEKWQDLLGEQTDTGIELPEIATATKAQVMAKIFENQQADIEHDPAYYDRELLRAFNAPNVNLSEAVIDGDHGSVDNIAKGQTTGAVTNIGPTVMGMVRRAIPNLIAFDVCGVQPMNGPTSQVFALRAVYGSNPLAANGKEAFHPTNAPDANYSGIGATNTTIVDLPKGPLTFGSRYKAVMTGSETGDEVRYFIAVGTADLTTIIATAGELSDAEYRTVIQMAGGVIEINEAMSTAYAELQEGFNGSSNNAWNEMSFRIDKQVVEAKSRQLKSQYSIELAQDLKAVHGMDADAELSSILANEVMVEINREIVNLINAQAQFGATGKTATSSPGTFSMTSSADIKGARWAGESYKALLIQIEKEANEIARQTGRGAGNFIITSRNVASALSMTDAMVSPATQGLPNEAIGNSTFAGVLAGRFKVYIDQYAVVDYVTVGYKGSNEMDAGVYYCPYIALTPLRGADSKNFQPVMGFKTRYGVQVNPFSDPTRGPNDAGKVSSGAPELATMGKNAYFRKFWVTGI